MLKIAKGTKKFHQRINSGKKDKIRKKEKNSKKAKQKNVKELKTITFEFANQHLLENYYKDLAKAVKKEGLQNYFTVCTQEGNCVILSTKEKHYKAANYCDLAINLLDILTEIQEEDLTHDICVYSRKGKKHLYISVGIVEGKFEVFSGFAKSLPGERLIYTSYYREMEEDKENVYDSFYGHYWKDDCHDMDWEEDDDYDEYYSEYRRNIACNGDDYDDDYDDEY